MFIAALIISSLALLLCAGLGALLWRNQRAQPREDIAAQLLQQQIAQLQQQLRESLEKNREEVTNHLQHQLSEWQRTHATVGSRLDKAADVVGQLNSRMQKVEEETRRVHEVGRDIASLQQILRAPKLRGNLGEQFLSELLSQILPPEAFSLQHSFKNGERVDAVIRTTGGLVSVDSKFPLENFQRLAAANTDDERTAHRKQFVADVKKHISDISDKYIRPAEGTFEFALMYIPAENVYYEVIARDLQSGETASLLQYALQKKVVPVSPNSFYAYLSTIMLGLRGLKVERFAQDILNQMTAVRRDVATFAEDFQLIGKHLGHASGAFAKAEKRLTRIDDRVAGLEQRAEPPAVAVAATEETALLPIQ